MSTPQVTRYCEVGHHIAYTEEEIKAIRSAGKEPPGQKSIATCTACGLWKFISSL